MSQRQRRQCDPQRLRQLLCARVARELSLWVVVQMVLSARLGLGLVGPFKPPAIRTNETTGSIFVASSSSVAPAGGASAHAPRALHRPREEMGPAASKNGRTMGRTSAPARSARRSPGQLDSSARRERQRRASRTAPRVKEDFRLGAHRDSPMHFDIQLCRVSSLTPTARARTSAAAVCQRTSEMERSEPCGLAFVLIAAARGLAVRLQTETRTHTRPTGQHRAKSRGSSRGDASARLGIARCLSTGRGVVLPVLRGVIIRAFFSANEVERVLYRCTTTSWHSAPSGISPRGRCCRTASARNAP